jgi:UDP-N-acetylglucosamine 2-epimerase (non-hydrolysing)
VEPAVAPFTNLAENEASPAFVAAPREHGFAFVTLHRPSNVDDAITPAAIIGAIVDVSHKLLLVFAASAHVQRGGAR